MKLDRLTVQILAQIAKESLQHSLNIDYCVINVNHSVDPCNKAKHPPTEMVVSVLSRKEFRILFPRRKSKGSQFSSVGLYGRVPFAPSSSSSFLTVPTYVRIYSYIQSRDWLKTGPRIALPSPLGRIYGDHSYTTPYEYIRTVHSVCLSVWYPTPSYRTSSPLVMDGAAALSRFIYMQWGP